jgi:hypothetical protein
MPLLMKHKILYDQTNDEQTYWRWYYPLISSILNNQSEDHPFEKTKVSKNQFLIEGTKVYQINGNEKNEFFIKGINLGAALPGKSFTEFPQDKSQYLEWFNQMSLLNVNVIRVYTLLPPAFYEGLYDYNLKSNKPLYLFQEIWPEENPIDGNYLDEAYDEAYRKEIDYVVSAIHGEANIPTRDYRAYGLYRFDISNYLLGYMVGREMEPEEVLSTDELNHGYTYDGTYIYSEENASPTEAWLASACDYTLLLEAKYNNKPLVGIVSWPTLDTLEHDSEWNEAADKSLQYNDSAVIDINHIGINKEQTSGFFGAYHIYPNYPDFMNNDLSYKSYRDEEGSYAYGGYLKAFIEQHTKYPAIVAEYGISTSMYTAHYSPTNHHQGGLTETQQGEGIVRMTKAILEEGYAGAIIFEWMDEWVKKTWTTEPYMIPFDRRAYWLNAFDPEQNYGILAYETDLKEATSNLKVLSKVESKNLKSIQTSQDESFLYIELAYRGGYDMNKPFNLALGTISDVTTDTFYLEYDKTPRLLVNPGYNWLKGFYEPIETSYEDYVELIQLTNNENTSKDGTYTVAKQQNLSQLKVGDFSDTTVQIEQDEDTIRIRLSYTLLGISDPSSRHVLRDQKVFVPIVKDLIETTESLKIEYQLFFEQEDIKFSHPLTPWDEIIYTSRMKDSTKIISDYFNSIN